MQDFEGLGSALQLLGCNPIEVEPRWMRPKPKHRPGNSVGPANSPGETPTTAATADPYQIMGSATEEQAAILHSSPATEPDLSHSESSFEVVRKRASLETEREVVPGSVPHSGKNPAACSDVSDQESSAMLPVLSSQSSCDSLPLGQKIRKR